MCCQKQRVQEYKTNQEKKRKKKSKPRNLPTVCKKNNHYSKGMKLIMISTIFSLTVFDRSEGTQDQGKHKMILVNQNLEMQNIQKTFWCTYSAFLFHLTER